MGDRRISIGFEPVWQDVDPHGMDTYLYWGDMRSWNDGTSCFGNTMVTQGIQEYGHEPQEGNYPTVTFDEWMSIEIMVKLNNPASAYNGELAVWINGERIGHWGPGFPNGHWLKDKWYNDPDGQAFEGFRWRNTSDLIINWLWILFFHSNPNAPEAYIKYDHIVMAKEYIGPIYSGSSSIKKSDVSKSKLYVFPNPSFGSISIKKLNDNQLSVGTMIRIYNTIGETVFSKTTNDQRLTIEVSLDHLPTGVYLIELIEDNTIYIEKFIKQTFH
ncbi:hypothetical protein BH23THE1_BH23THE1_35830 [soil metagenome]